MSPVVRRPVTQVERLLAYLRDHPGATSLEIIRDLAIVNTTGRISDIRAMPGFGVDCRKRPDGRDGYWLREQPAQLRLLADEAALQQEVEPLLNFLMNPPTQ